MSVVKRPEFVMRPYYSAGSRKPTQKLPKIENPPAIDYEQLRKLCRIGGLKNTQEGILQTTGEGHEAFMETYEDIFEKKPKKLGFPIHTEKRVDQHKATQSSSLTHNATGKTTDPEKKKKLGKEWPVDKVTHEIKDYLALLHKERKTEDPVLIRHENLKTLRRTLKKLPFRRTAADNDKIFNILQTFPFFKEHIPGNVLKELCVVALHEAWKEPDFTIFGNSGLHMVLDGTVAPLSHPYLNTDTDGNSGSQSTCSTPLVTETDDTSVELTVGDCFGTLRKVEGKDPGSKIYSVITIGSNCEFLKIPATDYARVIEQIKQREHTEKVNLLLSCGQYKLWPRQPLLQVAELIEWISYPPNTVLVSEGYKAPYIAFIKSGECHILRQVEVMHTLPNGKRAIPFFRKVLAAEEYKAPYIAIIKSGEACLIKQINVAIHTADGKKEKRTKQVVMGRLGVSESFAELSVLLDEQITCSVVTATDMTLGIIKPDRIQELDEVTVQLFKQSNNRTFGDLTKEDIQKEYMQQELKREWNEFKHSVLLDIINSRGIRPGYGKWAK